METVRFKKSGGPISVTITSGYAQPGSYNLILWEANSNSVVTRKEGNFINDEEDIFTLPAPVADNSGRILDLGVKLMIVPPNNDFNIQLTIEQDNTVIGKINQPGNSSGQFASVQIFVRLQEEE